MMTDALEDFYIYFYDIDLEKGIHFWGKSGWANQKENFRSISKILRKINHTHKKQLSDYYKYLLESHTR